MLFESYSAKKLSLANRIVMSPMTRSRAVDNNTPNSLMATYYAQRARAGLIITEGTSPSPNGLGYARIPGLFNQDHVKGWKVVTDAVHAKGGKIVVQLMHCGRVVGLANLPKGAKSVSPTNQVLEGEMYTDAHGMQPHMQPHALSVGEISGVVAEYAHSARLAIEAGFDGVELHAANGYLIEQFLNANVNKRQDAYGGNETNRNRFALEVISATVDAIGADHVGIRISPFGVFNGTGAFDGVVTQYETLVSEASTLGLLYVHLLDHSAMGAPAVPAALKTKLRSLFKGIFILAGGFTGETAKQSLATGQADLIGFGRPFISNPDLVARFEKNSELSAPDMGTFYTPGEAGYTDYPALTA